MVENTLRCYKCTTKTQNWQPLPEEW